jgi:hypothetical protein
LPRRNIGPQCDQFLGEQLRLIRARWREAIVNADIAAFLPAELLECLSECSQPRLGLGVIFDVADEHSDSAKLRRLLRARRERPSRRAAEQRDELATFPLIELHSRPLGRVTA